MSKGKVVIAMSGGVDSSVAAALLVQQGYEVTGMMLRLWSEPGCEADNRCCTPDAMAQARRVAAILGIPFYAVDAQEVFRRTVVQALLDGYAQGITPNPCLVCNREVRWGFLLQRALELGADFLATGHYLSLEIDVTGCRRILRGADDLKDQSYVLYMLTQAQLAHALFPLGGITKPEVRQLARQLNLPVAERPDSQDLCFLGEENYADFLGRQAPHTLQPGPILNVEGRILGEHPGLAFFTIGQRKGLKIAAPQPLYVLAKDAARNALVVGTADQLGGTTLRAENVNWICGTAPANPLRAQVKVRYKAQPAWALVTPLADSRVQVDFDAPLRDITPGQAAVFYDDQVCLGGGTIVKEA